MLLAQKDTNDVLIVDKNSRGLGEGFYKHREAKWMFIKHAMLDESSSKRRGANCRFMKHTRPSESFVKLRETKNRWNYPWIKNKQHDNEY